MAVYSSPGLRADATETIAKLAEDYWVPHNKSSWLQYDPQVIVDVYKKEILGSGFAIRKVMLLEFSQYLENYLWSHYDPKSASSAHLMSIVVMVNEKFRERVPAWQTFISKPEHFPEFFGKVMESALDENFTFSLREQTALLVFLIHCFNSMEVSLIREQIQRLVSLSAWRTLLPERREYEFRRFPKLKKFWAYIEKNDKKLDEDAYKKIVYEREFLSKLINRFFKYLESVPPTKDVPELDKPAMEVVHYCERFLELMIDLEALLPTRRFFNTIMDNTHLVVQCRLSVLAQRKEGRLFSQLLDRLNFYSRFEISDQTGEELKDHDMMQIHYDSITALQKAAFKGFPDLRRFALCNVANVDTREKLLNHFGTLQTKDLHAIAASLFLVPAPKSDSEGSPYSHSFLKELLISRHEKRQSQLDSLNEMPLYPTETIIWDENVVPSEYFSGEGCLALPKLNLQFLTLHDYLLRNFHLFRLESTYEIRQDIEDAVSRLKPWQTEDGGVMFGGWARMAQAIVNFAIVEVGKPNIGEKQPSKVRADVTVHLNVRREIKAEWEALRKHDVCFLITVRPVCTPGTPYNYKEPFVPQVGLTYVRGCEIEGLLDLNGRVIEEGPEPKPVLPGDSRTYRVWMDCNQYKLDMDQNVKGTEDVYETFNILMRRKPKENNFKAVLETIRDLMNTECVVPDWLHDIILGYGDPGAAHYSKMSNQIATLNFNDTFLNMDHLRASFGEKCDIHVDVDDPRKLEPPFKVTFCDVKQQQVAAKSKKPKDKPEAEETRGKEKILVTPHVAKSRGPYPSERAKKNAVPFTPTQVEAIRAGMQPGLTIIVGPPGTGKTDVAVQIISNLYHNFPDQRTLLVTHSNQALNQLFEKIMMLDMDERHLLRLGHGEEALETEKDFSRYGRVNYVLGKRLQLLEEVSRLQESLGVTGDVSYTCETAGYFYLYQNLAEAEYVVAVFTYMRLLGYPAERISILTTYNGQKHLIRDVVRQRCQDNPLVGCPLKVTTVDKYQGQQNDYVLLSLVRTRAVGHLRDVRRLVVAMSRARLGLYVFARTALFRDCFELGPTFSLLLQRPTQLWLAPWEAHPTMRPNSVPPQGEPFVVTGMTQMAQFVFDFYQQRVEALTAQLRAHKAVYEKPALAAPAKERQPAMVASSEAKPESDSKADEADKTIHKEQSEKPEEGAAAHHETSSPQPPATSAAEETRPVEEAAAQQRDAAYVMSTRSSGSSNARERESRRELSRFLVIFDEMLREPLLQLASPPPLEGNRCKRNPLVAAAAGSGFAPAAADFFSGVNVP
ncbi:hypothetical protein HPB47_001399 [Ixodes persulcatus]|uniref:Uncharacterized protein n=1 Tax=Ixodes persulcatus TaxID=34615 RepID=A0AC60PP51_IXOPE|nr:hypothetical protein HPB47_001399 [Ixodes persulcatus]